MKVVLTCGLNELYFAGFICTAIGFTLYECNKMIKQNPKIIEYKNGVLAKTEYTDHFLIIGSAIYGLLIGCVYGAAWPIFGPLYLYNRCNAITNKE